MCVCEVCVAYSLPPSFPPLLPSLPNTKIYAPDGGKLDYEAFFKDKIDTKRKDNSYRTFRVMARQARQFPRANHYPEPNTAYEDGRDVTVWCSNDYMGMSKHPEVVAATM